MGDCIYYESLRSKDLLICKLTLGCCGCAIFSTTPLWSANLLELKKKEEKENFINL